MFVVLPFENLTGDPKQEYIADGMTEEMITQLGGLDPEHLGVIARTSAMRFKGTQKSAAEIARELGVSYLLEGSVRHVGDRMRITAQLIQASDETHLWASDYDSDLSNLLQLESDIAAVVASQVQVKLMSNERTRYNQTVKPEAQAAYLRGLEDWNLRTGSSIADAISEFNGAIAADPSYALPFAALARCYVLGPIFGLGNPLETMPKARESQLMRLSWIPTWRKRTRCWRWLRLTTTMTGRLRSTNLLLLCVSIQAILTRTCSIPTAFFPARPSQGCDRRDAEGNRARPSLDSLAGLSSFEPIPGRGATMTLGHNSKRQMKSLPISRCCMNARRTFRLYWRF